MFSKEANLYYLTNGFPNARIVEETACKSQDYNEYMNIAMFDSLKNGLIKTTNAYLAGSIDEMVHVIEIKPYIKQMVLEVFERHAAKAGWTVDRIGNTLKLTGVKKKRPIERKPDPIFPIPAMLRTNSSGSPAIFTPSISPLSKTN